MPPASVFVWSRRNGCREAV